MMIFWCAAELLLAHRRRVWTENPAYLQFQLLNHLHLNATLCCALVVKRVLAIQMSAKKKKKVKISQIFIYFFSKMCVFISMKFQNSLDKCLKVSKNHLTAGPFTHAVSVQSVTLLRTFTHRAAAKMNNLSRSLATNMPCNATLDV